MREALPETLPATFAPAQAASCGISEGRLRALVNAGTVERIGRGIYRRGDAELADIDLVEVAARAPEATLCLETALARHDLSDLIPSHPDIAIPNGRRPPAVQMPVTWHKFSPATFTVGRETMPLDSVTSIGIYSAERAIVDTMRLRHQQGPEVAYIAIKRYLRQPGGHPKPLLAVARHFPQALPELRKVIEIILA